ncbi:ABC transporter permease [Acidisoma cladoniae]|jgi:putative spermidine/putrescine transport system permease protein|uniref:ABC transporter permease n=1 Tax=Acidisoma cladoniae TaxID=3040935 RepID=UPI00254A2B39|nr:spermidine/putrescine ABC transporter permease [Acidisoma sp. PAMC 29798]
MSATTSAVSVPTGATRVRKPRLGLSSTIILILAAIFFLVPLIMTGIFSLWEGGNTYGFSAYVLMLHTSGFWYSFFLSLRLAVETILLSFVLLVPAMIFVHLKAPQLRPLFEFISTLPFVIPAIALIDGLTTLYTGPSWLISTPNYLVIPYFFLALPYGFRALDVGLMTLDVKTLTEAGQSLGAGWGRIIFLLLLPNLTTALIGATLLTLTIVMGEFTFASVLLFHTFAVFINDTGQNAITEAAALSLFSFVITWLFMLGVLLTGRRNAATVGGAH